VYDCVSQGSNNELLCLVDEEDDDAEEEKEKYKDNAAEAVMVSSENNRQASSSPSATTTKRSAGNDSNSSLLVFSSNHLADGYGDDDDDDETDDDESTSSCGSLGASSDDDGDHDQVHGEQQDRCAEQAHSSDEFGTSCDEDPNDNVKSKSSKKESSSKKKAEKDAKKKHQSRKKFKEKEKDSSRKSKKDGSRKSKKSSSTDKNKRKSKKSKKDDSKAKGSSDSKKKTERKPETETEKVSATKSDDDSQSETTDTDAVDSMDDNSSVDSSKPKKNKSRKRAESVDNDTEFVSVGFHAIPMEESEGGAHHDDAGIDIDRQQSKSSPDSSTATPNDGDAEGHTERIVIFEAPTIESFAVDGGILDSNAIDDPGDVDCDCDDDDFVYKDFVSVLDKRDKNDLRHEDDPPQRKKTSVVKHVRHGESNGMDGAPETPANVAEDIILQQQQEQLDELLAFHGSLKDVDCSYNNKDQEFEFVSVPFQFNMSLQQLDELSGVGGVDDIYTSTDKVIRAAQADVFACSDSPLHNLDEPSVVGGDDNLSNNGADSENGFASKDHFCLNDLDEPSGAGGERSGKNKENDRVLKTAPMPDGINPAFQRNTSDCLTTGTASMENSSLDDSSSSSSSSHDLPERDAEDEAGHEIVRAQLMDNASLGDSSSSSRLNFGDETLDTVARDEHDIAGAQLLEPPMTPTYGTVQDPEFTAATAGFKSPAHATHWVQSIKDGVGGHHLELDILELQDTPAAATCSTHKLASNAKQSRSAPKKTKSSDFFSRLIKRTNAKG
jgi:hypothetical protein